MKKYKVKISSLALRDMEEIYGYISEKLGSPATAIKQYERIAEAIESLSVFPERFQIMNIIPKLSKDVRQVIVDHYSAIYTIEADTVTVLRVLYGASDLSAKLQGRLSWQKKYLRDSQQLGIICIRERKHSQQSSQHLSPLIRF